MTGMTLEPGAPADTVEGIANRCLRRKSLRTYELLDPTRPGGGEGVCYDVGQLKEIVLMDRRLREEGTVTSVPAGFLDFATRFNAYAEGPERFATYGVINGKYVIHKDGSPIVWEHFLISNSLVSWGHVQQPGVPRQEQDSLPVFGFMDGSSSTQLHSLSTHMNGAVKTTDQLTRFWIKRGAIEQQYASRLADLAEAMIGEDELPEIRGAIDGLRIETAKQAMNRFELAKQIAVELESCCVELQAKQCKHWRQTFEPAARKLHHAQVREKRRRSGVATEWKQEYKKLRYSLDIRRLESMKTRELSCDSLSTPTSSDWNVTASTESPTSAIEMLREWENLRESCAQLEQDRSGAVKSMLSAFSDTLNWICATDNESCAIMKKSKDLFNVDNLIEEFDQKFGSVQCHRSTIQESTSRGSAPRPFSSCLPKTRVLPLIPSANIVEETFPLRRASSMSRSLPSPPPNVPLLRKPAVVENIRNPLLTLPFASNHARRPLTPQNIASTSRQQQQHQGRPTLHKISTTFSNSQFV